jgi:hypothetical protein
MTNQEIETAVEEILDRSSVLAMLEALGAICSAKAEHVQDVWDDRAMAMAWQRVGMIIDHAATRLDKLSLDIPMIDK